MGIISKKFGKLTVLRKDKDRKYSYICECECSTIKSICKSSLINGNSKSCGCMKGRRLDLIGRRFGFLTVVSLVPGKGKSRWLCRCDCGNKKIIVASSLTCGFTKSCGCWQKNFNKKNLKNKRFGKLVVIEEAASRDGKTWWLCKCDCGNEKKIPAKNLIKDNCTKSCGCLVKEQNKKNRLPRGYASFNRLLCTYKIGARKRNLEFKIDDDQFKKLTKQNCYYCGREPSTTQHSKNNSGDYVYNGIDRINNAKGYSLDNCVPCCFICNKMKMDLNVNDFFERIKNIYDKHLLDTQIKSF